MKRRSENSGQIEEYTSYNVGESFPQLETLQIMEVVPLYYGGGGDIVIVSEVTGKKYRFIRGKPTFVDEVDADYFMTLTKKTGCCGKPKTDMKLFGTL